MYCKRDLADGEDREVTIKDHADDDDDVGDDDEDDDDDDDDTYLPGTQVLHGAGQGGDVPLVDRDVHLAGYKAGLWAFVLALPIRRHT